MAKLICPMGIFVGAQEAMSSQCSEMESSNPDPDSWDGTAIWRIYKAGGSGLVGKLCGLFLEEAGQKIDSLSRSVQWGEIKRVAHGFKTNCRMMGAEKMAALCHEIVVHSEKGSELGGSEMAADEVAKLAPHVEELQAAYGEVQERVKQIHEAALRGESPPGDPPD